MNALAADDADPLLLRPDRFSTTQRRSIDAAMELFADHGVAATSFQMIADAVGVTKAAIYHQFKTKDAIVLAVAEVGMAPLQDALARAEAETSRERAREVVLAEVIDLAIARRRWVGALQGDRVMIELLGSHPPFLELMNRVYALLLGLDDDPSVLMRTAVVSAAIGGALVHPLVAEFDDETLRAELLAVTRRLFELPD